MRRHKLTVHILVILSIFNSMSVLAAPIATQGVREASVSVVDEGRDVTIVLGKRAGVGPWPEPWSEYHGLTQASPSSKSLSAQMSTSSTDSLGSPSMPKHPSGVHQEMINPLSSPYASGGRELPWFSKTRNPPYALGGTELPWYSKPGRAKVPLVQPSKIPASSVRTKTDKWVPAAGVESASPSLGKGTPASSLSGEVASESSLGTEAEKTGIEPASSSPGKISPPPSSEVLSPGPSEQEGYKETIPQYKSVLDGLGSEVKLRPIP